VVLVEQILQNFVLAALNETVRTFWEPCVGVSQTVAGDTQMCSRITARAAI